MLVGTDQGGPVQGYVDIPVTWPGPGSVIRTSAGLWYTVGQPINSGGYALVYEATNVLGQPVALKIFKPTDRPFREVESQWQREIRVFQKLKHENVVSIHDS